MNLSTNATLLELFGSIAKYKLMILAISSSVMIVATLATFLITPVYRSEILLAPVTERATPRGLGSLVSQLGNLSSFSIPGLNHGANAKNEAIATLLSRDFTKEFIVSENLLPIIFDNSWDENAGTWNVSAEDVPTLSEAFQCFDEDIRTVTEDRVTGLITLTIDWHDRHLASQWANELVKRVNERLRQRAVAESEKSINYLQRELRKTSVVELQQAIYRLIEAQIKEIMIANVRDEYSFKVIDSAEVPDENDYVSPNRPIVATTSLIVGLLIATAIAFVMHARQQSQ